MILKSMKLNHVKENTSLPFSHISLETKTNKGYRMASKEDFTKEVIFLVLESEVS